MKSNICLTIALVFTIVIFTACSGGEKKEVRKDSEGDKQTTTTTKDTLVAMDSAVLNSLNPYGGNTGSTLFSTKQVFDTLVQRDKDGNITPNLAESWEESEDGKQLKMNLRQDVKFTDNTPFNADAVLFNYNLIKKDPFYGPIFAQSFSNIEKIDDFTIMLTKSSSYSAHLQTLATFLFMVSPTAYEADPEAFGKKPVGTGAYKLDRFNAAAGIAYLIANENYHEGAPKIKNLEIRGPVDSATALVSLETGEVNLVQTLTGDDIRLAEEAGFTVDNSEQGFMQESIIFFGEPYSSDENLRKAIGYAVNKENAIVSNGNNYATPAENLFASKIMREFEGNVEIPQYDVAKAKEYLSKSKYNNEELEINVLSQYQNVATSIQSDLDAVGIKVNINMVDNATLHQKMENGTAQIVINTIGGVTSSLESMLGYFATGGMYEALAKSAVPKGYDELLKKMSEEWIADNRYDDTLKALQKLTDSGNIIPLYEYPATKVYSASLKGYEPLNIKLSGTYFE